VTFNTNGAPVPAALPTLAPPRVFMMRIGVTGTSVGVGATGADATEGPLVPMALAAVTVNVYASPFVNPPTVHDSAPVVEH
jgi:hypothetical protein